MYELSVDDRFYSGLAKWLLDTKRELREMDFKVFGGDLADGTIHFALYGSSLNHNLIGWNSSNSQSESFLLAVLKAAMERKESTIRKSNEKWDRKRCQK